MRSFSVFLAIFSSTLKSWQMFFFKFLLWAFCFFLTMSNFDPDRRYFAKTDLKTIQKKDAKTRVLQRSFWDRFPFFRIKIKRSKHERNRVLNWWEVLLNVFWKLFKSSALKVELCKNNCQKGQNGPFFKNSNNPVLS